MTIADCAFTFVFFVLMLIAMSGVLTFIDRRMNTIKVLSRMLLVQKVATLICEAALVMSAIGLLVTVVAFVIITVGSMLS